MSAASVSPPSIPAALATEIRAAMAQAKASGRTRFLAWAEALPSLAAADGLRVFAWAGSRDRTYWERVESGELFSAWGSLDEIEHEGAERFAAVRAWHRDLSTRLRIAGAVRPAGSPICLGGFGFDANASADPDWKSFPAAQFRLPEGLVERVDGSSRAIVFARIDPAANADGIEADFARRLAEVRAAVSYRGAGSCPAADRADGDLAGQGPEYRVRADRSHAHFSAQVEHALAEIASGRLAKLVLARSLVVDHDDAFDVPGFLVRLRALFPSCTLVAVGRGRDTFLAATPESLVRVRGLRLETAALAGSTARGRTPEEDIALAQALLASPKERAEHAHVVDAMRAVLAPRCARIEIAGEPSLRRLVGIQHLETAFEGELAPAPNGAAPAERSGEILSLVEALHDARRRRRAGDGGGGVAAPS